MQPLILGQLVYCPCKSYVIFAWFRYGVNSSFSSRNFLVLIKYLTALYAARCSPYGRHESPADKFISMLMKRDTEKILPLVDGERDSGDDDWQIIEEKFTSPYVLADPPSLETNRPCIRFYQPHSLAEGAD